MKTYNIEENVLKELVEGYLKFQSLKNCGVEQWRYYYDALSEPFVEPVDDYEDYEDFVSKYIKQFN